MKETVFLNNDREMPLLGLGVYKLPDDVQAEVAVTSDLCRLPHDRYRIRLQKTKKAWDVPSPNVVFPEGSFSSPARSGTQPSGW